VDQNRIALVTLASDHAGPAVAHRLASLGFRLVLQGADQALASSLRDAGALFDVSEEDLLTPGSAQKLVDEAISRYGAIEAAWVRTGVVAPEISKPFLDSSDEFWASLKLHNIDMLIYVLRALLPPMLAAGTGQILVSTSATGLKPIRGASLYGASRAAAIALVRALGLEYAASGVTINAIATNFLDSPTFRAAASADDVKGRERIERSVPVGRLGAPEELAEFAAVLLDGRTRFQTGQCFSFSGGWSA